MLILSHRGLRARAAIRENTLPAFEAAIRAGMDGIETDVRRAGDGTLVLYHDRLLPDGAPVSSRSRDEISRAAGLDVPSLEEALGLAPNMFWNLEVKAPDAAEPTYQSVRRSGRLGHVLFTSFFHDVVAWYAGTLQVSCGILISHRPTSLEALAGPWRDLPRMRTVVWNLETLDGDLVSRLSASGFDSFCYNLVTRKDHEAAVRAGVSGIITDDPSLLVRRSPELLGRR